MTHNLTITKMALQLQEEEAPKFDISFVTLGGFHIQGAVFVVFGKYIAKCGGPDILNECHITEKRSLKSFISGKGYKKNQEYPSATCTDHGVSIFSIFFRIKRNNRNVI